MPNGDVAFFSDIHGNLPALKVVLADIETRGIRGVICLGDIVGYGGNPAECVALVQASGCRVVMGNHEWMTLLEREPTNFCEASIQWARQQLSADQKDWLAALPLTLEAEDYEAVHSSLWEPDTWMYVRTESHADLHFKEQRKPVCFIGHTHVPRIWVEGAERPIDPIGSEDMRVGKRHIVNVGSVGQPRDGDPDACYLIYSRESRVFRYRRLAYDVDAAQKAIIAAGLAPYYAQRLEFGK
jgi:diadenosine tetraphosphatase ApaH/serine/threonine PP2A family protein phosphatase